MTRMIGYSDGAEAVSTRYWSFVDACTASSVQARSGQYSYLLGSSGTGPSKTITSANTLSGRFGMWYTTQFVVTDNRVLDLRTGTTNTAAIGIRHATGQVILYVGNTIVAASTLTVGPSKWHLIEFAYLSHASSGEFYLWIDGVLDTSYLGNTGGAAIDNFRFARTTAVTMYIDDLAFDDSLTQIGNGYIENKLVIEDGDTDNWTPSAGANWECVDERPPDDDTSYVESDTAGEVDLYRHAAFDATGRTITRVWIEAHAKGTAGGEQMRLRAQTSATHNGSTITLTANYLRYTSEYALSPDSGLTWEDSELDALQSGQERL